MGTRRCELLQRRTHPATEAAVDLATAARAFGYAPAVYRPVSPVRNDLPQVRNTAGALGLRRVRVGGRCGVRRWSQRFCFGNGDRYLLSTAFTHITFWSRLNKLNKELWFFK